MGIKERRQEEKEAIRRKIIEAASEIVVKEGYENLSIRKIAAKIEYSPGTIYQYFMDKGAIVALIVEEEYGKIIKRISKIPINMENPEQSLVEGLKVYIELMLESPAKFRAIVMNDIEDIQQKVNILDKGISKKRKSMESMCNLLAICIEKGIFREMDTELTAQLIWTSTYGLVSRFILEKDIPPEQRERLINHHFQILLHGLLK